MEIRLTWKLCSIVQSATGQAVLVYGSPGTLSSKYAAPIRRIIQHSILIRSLLKLTPSRQGSC